MRAARSTYVRDNGVSTIDPIERRKAWARDLIARGKGAPAYGTPEWNALPDGPQKVAAVVRAAECWATEGDDLIDNLRAEVEYMPLALKRAEDAEFVARGLRHAKAWKGGRPKTDPLLVAEVIREWGEWVKADESADSR